MGCCEFNEFNSTWPWTEAGQEVILPCPSPVSGNIFFIFTISGFQKYPFSAFNASRECGADGIWLRANYNVCQKEIEKILNQTIPKDTYNSIALIQFTGSMISLALLTLTFYIFASFRSIQCSRLSVHKNLVVACILYYVINIIYFEPQITLRKGKTQLNIPWISNLLKALILFTKMSSTNWLFNEGFYLHSRITTSIFDSEAPFLFFHSIGWGKVDQIFCFLFFKLRGFANAQYLLSKV